MELSSSSPWAVTRWCSAPSPSACFGQQVSLASFALQKVGTYQVEAVYMPNSTRFAESTSAPVTVTRHSADGRFLPRDPRRQSRWPQ